MRARSFRRRLDRLEQAINKAEEQNKDRFAKFSIDPALVKALRDDYERLWELSRKEFLPLNREESKGLSVAEMEEKAILRKRITDSVKSVRLPPEYGAKEAELDRRRLRVLEERRQAPRARLSDAEFVEEVQLRARFSAFGETPEGRGRNWMREMRMTLLIQKCGGESNTFEQNEFARLNELYPPLELPPDPEDEDVKRLLRMINERNAG